MAFGVRVRRLRTSGGDELLASPEGIVAIVGPNNSGKSAFLRELHYYLSQGPGAVPPLGLVLAEVEVEKEGEVADLLDWLQQHAYSQIRTTERVYKRAHADWTGEGQLSNNWNFGPGFAQLAPFIAFLAQAEGRLGQLGGSGQYDVMNDRPGNPMQVLYARRDLEEKLSQLSVEAFGIGVTLNRFGSTLVLLWGEVDETPPPFPAEEYMERLRGLQPVQNQGDGVKSFLGTMLLLLTASYPLVFIDEPEAFLHPPQAQLMGRKLRSELPAGTQAFVATHSLDVVEGLLEGAGRPVTIGRLTRSGDVNRLSVLNPGAVEHLWRDPLLRYSNVLEGLFHRGVVVCEGDADCRFYNAVLDVARSDEGSPPHDLLFTHCGGKQRIATVVRALRAVDVPVVVIADFDVLREAQPFGEIITALGRDPALFEGRRNSIAAGLSARARSPSRAFVIEEVQNVLTASDDPSVTRDEADTIRTITRWEDGWKSAKESGLASIPRGGEYNAAEGLLDDLREVGLIVVGVGELEGWVREVGHKGPRWVVEVLEQNLHVAAELSARRFVDAAANAITSAE